MTGVLGDLDVSALNNTRLDAALRAAAALPPASTSMAVKATAWLARLVGDLRQCVRSGDWSGVRQALVGLWDVAGGLLAHGKPGGGVGDEPDRGYASVTPAFRTWARCRCNPPTRGTRACVGGE